MLSSQTISGNAFREWVAGVALLESHWVQFILNGYSRTPATGRNKAHFFFIRSPLYLRGSHESPLFPNRATNACVVAERIFDI